MEKTFKIRLSNETKDEHLKMGMTYHLPMSCLPIILQYLEEMSPRPAHKK